jgi:hypothetical protein
MGEVTKLKCYYCLVFDKKDELAYMTAHDRRGCKHVCFKHAKWRLSHSWMFGHSSDCVIGDVKA